MFRMQRLRRPDDAGLAISLEQHKEQGMGRLGGDPQRPGLLVSVRNLDEARVAAAARVSIIDLKEPNQGSLGPTTTEVWHAVANELAGCTLSAALGELDAAVTLASWVPPQFRFVKAGPVGARSVDELISGWQRVRTELPSSVELVAVAYADHEQAHTLPAEAIYAAAWDAGLSTWLLDTFVKDGRTSVEHLGVDRLKSLLQYATKVNARFALAGSLTQASIQPLLTNAIWPSWFAVRGDVCDQGRTGRLSPERISSWMTLFESIGRQ